jgi:hypothetical protein
VTHLLSIETTSRRSHYLVVIAPGGEKTGVRYRQLETESDLAIGDGLFLDERSMRVSGIGDAPEDYDATLIVSAVGHHGS